MGELPVIVLAGYSAAGKSTLTAALELRYGFVPMHQYPIYKDLATAKGYTRSREWLAEVGNSVFVAETALETARRIQELQDPKGIVIDASYGEEMHRILRENLPNARVIVIAVQVDSSQRTIRLMGRMNADLSDAETERQFRDAFLQQVGLDEVMANADFIVTNIHGLEVAMEQISNGLSKFGL